MASLLQKNHRMKMSGLLIVSIFLIPLKPLMVGPGGGGAHLWCVAPTFGWFVLPLCWVAPATLSLQ